MNQTLKDQFEFRKAKLIEWHAALDAKSITLTEYQTLIESLQSLDELAKLCQTQEDQIWLSNVKDDLMALLALKK